MFSFDCFLSHLTEKRTGKTRLIGHIATACRKFRKWHPFVLSGAASEAEHPSQRQTSTYATLAGLSLGGLLLDWAIRIPLLSYQPLAFQFGCDIQNLLQIHLQSLRNVAVEQRSCCRSK